MSTKLLLVRHGESVWNVEGRIQGQADGPLSAAGALQALALARALRERDLAAVYSSPLLRALQTARAICQPHGLELIDEPAFQEINLGAWQGRTGVELEADPEAGYPAWRRSPRMVTPPGGETLDQATARAAEAVRTAATAHPGAMIAVVTHSIVGRLILCSLLEARLDLVSRLKLKKASISTIRLHEGRAVLESLGDTSHLHAVSRTTQEPILD
jgi:broad specificity phosphatase PhoE